jgi:hypothetical protein
MGFWGFVRLCLQTTWDATLSKLKWDAETVIIGAASAICGYLLFWWARGAKNVQDRAWEDFLLLFAPAGVLAVILFIFNGLRSPYLVYKKERDSAQQIVTQLESRARDAEQKLAVEMDKSQPKFEIGWATAILGNDTLTNKTTGATEHHTHVFLPVTVLNHGAPSIIRNLRMAVALKDGRSFEGYPFLPNQKELVFNLPDGPIKFSTESSLMKKGTANPIPTGGQADGFIYYEFPPGLLQDFYDPETVFTLEVKDINRKVYAVKIPGGPAPPLVGISPGVVQIPPR